MAITPEKLAQARSEQKINILYKGKIYYINRDESVANKINIRGQGGDSQNVDVGIYLTREQALKDLTYLGDSQAQQIRQVQPTTREQIYSNIYGQSKAETFWTAQERARVNRAEETAQSTQGGITFRTPVNITSYDVIDPSTAFRAKLQPEIPKGIIDAKATVYTEGKLKQPVPSVYTKAPQIETIEGVDLVGFVSPRRLESSWSPAESFISYGALGLTRFYTGTKEVGRKAIFGSPMERIEAFEDVVIGATAGIPYGIAYNVKNYGFSPAAAGLTFGELSPAIVGFKAIKYIPKPRLVYTDLPLESGLTSRITTLGIEAGTRKLGIVSYSTGKLKLGLPEISDRPLRIAQNVELPAPVGALESEVMARTTLTPAQYSSFQSKITVLRSLSGEKGLPVEEVTLDLPLLKNEAKASKVIMDIAAQEDLIIFGSQTKPQLPSRYRVISGDVDLLKAGGTQEQAMIITNKLNAGLRSIGENVRISTRAGQQKAIIETLRGEKILEIKTGTEADAMLSGSPPAQAGYAGFDFPNLRAGILGKTVKFGDAKAIYAGEQLLRKGAASGFFRGETTNIKTPKALRAGGMFPLGKRPKDLADFYIQALGVEETRVFRDSVIVKKIRSSFIEGYTPEQRVEITKLIKKRITGEEFAPERVFIKPVKSSFLSSVISKAEPTYSYSFKSSSVLKSAYSVSDYSTSRYSSAVSSAGSMASSVISKSGSPSSRSSYSSVLSSIARSTSRSPSASSYLSKYSTSPSKYLSKYDSTYRSGYASPSTSSLISSFVSQPKGSRITLSSDSSVFTKSFSKGYIPYVRREGKFYPLSRIPLSKSAALGLGGKIVDTTAAATFYIREVTAQDVADLGGNLKKPQFYRKGNKYIEYSKYRINTAGELKDITYKGIRTKSAKINLKRLF